MAKNQTRAGRGQPMPQAEEFEAVMLSDCRLAGSGKVSVDIGGHYYHLPVTIEQFRQAEVNPPQPGNMLRVRIGLAAVGQPRVEAIIPPATASSRQRIDWLMPPQGAKSMRAKRGPE